MKMQLISQLKKCAGWLLDVVYPPFCSFCKTFIDRSFEQLVFCEDCFVLMQPVVSSSLKITETYTVPVFALGAYKDPLKRLVTAKHYRNPKAAEELGSLLWGYTDLKHVPFDVIVPVPLHWTRYAFRWYNQATCMANALSFVSGKSVVHALERIRKTTSQKGLSKDQRSGNVKYAFDLTQWAQRCENKHVLVLDDVLTTGATMTAAIKALRRCNPSSITVAVACRVI